MTDVGFDYVSVSFQLVEFLHDGVNFCSFCTLGWLLLKLLGVLHFIVVVNAGSSVELIIEALRWRFDHGDCVFVQFEVVSAKVCVGYQVMNQNKYCGIDWVMCLLEYSAYYRWITCGVDNEYDNECDCGVWWSCSCWNYSMLDCGYMFRFRGLLGLVTKPIFE